MRGAATHLLQRVIDRLLRVDNRWTLNADREPGDDINVDLVGTFANVVEKLSTEGFDERGLMDYESLKSNPLYQQYQQLTAKLCDFDPSSLGSRAERLAFWINLYNCLIVDAVVTLGIKKTVWEAGKGFFRKVAYSIGGLRYSADDIEHGILRGNRRHPAVPLPQFAPDDPRLRQAIIPLEPRVHFTLVCASRSCPIIRVYHGPDMEEELEMAANTFVNGGGVVVTPEKAEVSLSRIFKWFQGDFGGRSGVIEFILRYLTDGPEKDFLHENAGSVRIVYQQYDWSLNHQ